MSGVATAVVGAAVIGGVIASKSQKDAAKTAAGAQTAAAEAGISEQQRQFDAMRQILSPYVSAGDTALNQQMALLGIGGQQPYAQGQQIGAEMKGVSGMSGGTLDNAYGTFEPQLQPSQGISPQKAPQFNPSQGISPQQAQQNAISGILQSPQFQAMTQQGENAILQNASATGGLRGGNVQAALAQYRPQILSQLIESQYQKLAGISQLGQASAAGVGSAGIQTGANIANLYGQQGAAQAGQAIATGQANAQAVGDITSTLGTLGTLQLMGKF